ncbi:MAG: HD-like signal output (HDOD) protein [Gammaproteobacteria bacterium]|jgi:HD-like signal output (HDOD) protein
MSLETAQKWWNSKNPTLPAIDYFHSAAVTCLDNPILTLTDLADIVTQDPGMSLSLFSQVNGQLSKNGRGRTETIHATLALLGNSAISDFIHTHKTLGKAGIAQDCITDYHQLISRGYHFQEQLAYLISSQGLTLGHELKSAAILHNIGEMMVCLADHDQYLIYQQEFHNNGSDVISAKPVFGFDFHELGTLVSDQCYLPELMLESLKNGPKVGRKIHSIQLSADISHHAEEGWNHSALRATTKATAVFLNMPHTEFEKNCYQNAIKAAHLCPIENVIPAAARLINLPHIIKTEPLPIDPPSKQTERSPPSFESSLKALLKYSDSNQAQLISLLLKHLHESLGFSHTALMLLSRDNKTLAVRLNHGYDPDSPFLKLSLETARSGLLLSLLKKPLALWVSSADYSKYSSMIPGKFQAASLSENYCVMALFVDKKPVGIVYCDRKTSVNPIDKLNYQAFKTCIMLANRGLLILSSRNQTKAV